MPNPKGINQYSGGKGGKKTPKPTKKAAKPVAKTSFTLNHKVAGKMNVHIMDQGKNKTPVPFKHRVLVADKAKPGMYRVDVAKLK